MTAILEVKHLVKQYGKNRAVDGISFAIEAGTCFGLLGPNGAGKTTTIEMIEKVIVPDGGEILYKGRPRSSGFLEEVGIQFQETELLAFLTVRETLHTFGRLYQNAMDVDEAMALCDLTEVASQQNDNISGGQRQRLWLALALINQPDLLFLDEPSTGLDPNARLDLWQVIDTIKQQGRTIVLTTHYMEEAEKLCDEIAIMHKGRIIARDTPKKLISTYFNGITVTLPVDGLTKDMEKQYTVRRKTDGHMEIETNDANACLARLMDSGVDLTDISIRTPNLEDVFIHLTGKRLSPNSGQGPDQNKKKV
ncbi:MAG: ABC transporter ATP-binding protein [Deltaproteobacteria bacterium]|nr:MAG: ABC transporter ATP-binding protein [Deltaproteobacteria bacterium]